MRCNFECEKCDNKFCELAYFSYLCKLNNCSSFELVKKVSYDKRRGKFYRTKKQIKELKRLINDIENRIRYKTKHG